MRGLAERRTPVLRYEQQVGLDIQRLFAGNEVIVSIETKFTSASGSSKRGLSSAEIFCMFHKGIPSEQL
jgi:hypothetical protein